MVFIRGNCSYSGAVRMTKALLEKLEAATGPSRELDILIALELGWCWVDDIADYRDPQDFERPIPAYTESLDAAIPGEDIVVVAAPGYFASSGFGHEMLWSAIHRGGSTAQAATEPLVRRGAALKARQTQEGI